MTRTPKAVVPDGEIFAVCGTKKALEIPRANPRFDYPRRGKKMGKPTRAGQMPRRSDVRPANLDTDRRLLSRCRNNHDGIAAGFTGIALGACRAGFARVALETRRTLGAGIALGAGCALGARRTLGAGIALRARCALWSGRTGHGRGRNIYHGWFFTSAQTKHRYERYEEH